MAKLTFTLTVDGLPEETFVVTSYQGKESLSDSRFDVSQACYGFRYNIELASRQSSIRAQQVVDKAAQLTMKRDGEAVQYVNGIVRQFSHGDIGHHHTSYSLILVSALERLSLRHNSRIFQFKTTQDIISQILQEMGVVDFSFALKRTLSQREFCVQYRETDLAFVHRLAAEEGITYYMEQADGKHTVVFFDDSALIKKYSGPVPHNGLAGGLADEPFVSQFRMEHQREASHLVLKDYSFKKPNYGFLQEQQGTDLSFQQSTYEHYDFPGRYKDDGSGSAFSQTRLEFLRRDSDLGRGKSNHPALQAGVKFDLSENLEASANRDWVVVEVAHQGTQPQALEEDGGHGATTYSNQFTVIPANKTWRAKPQPKPQVDGPMIAKVVGPAGEEIYCDEHGRVKVHFPWDRESKQNEHSSCWIRVSQGWAGAQYGFMAIPRIGHEVIVSFLHGDPDQPIITGRTYHATNVTPYILPNHKTRTVIKTQTHQGEGSNEIRFEDQASIEQIFIHAQKDQDIITENNHRELVGVDRHLRVGRNWLQMITENVNRMVGKNVIEEFGQDHQIKIGRDVIKQILGKISQHVVGGIISKIDGSAVTQIGASEEKEIGANQRVSVANESYLKATKVVLEAGDSLTIKGPGGFVKIDGGGVTISGTKVKINEGGSPDTGTHPAMIKPQAPDKPQEPDGPDERG
ncbi:TPA: type VI secretion system tip protein VgrG [Vibrio vulnificus]|uniref:type VI secretion system Vgr family protein n=1 Tax=Vibrio vulnificus TaxID=672 RepID=UPI001A250684|nr:type VI secretion system tip protein VgrG [Vibrio vulnificus]HAU8259972.1 type VI secretion system tip protein VgrG [Vibrio vulnificus]HDY7619942.1 type VI secretion system tip protein VgrG [Vibrio vulnificus]HDY8107697.1 type VI secretion system tip protein VgrG [Vibrio vulnificus]HDZ3715325.1 type VI secretion system tip protein VgrG [Vibrio vulnificus]